jgi:hypothetical protein
MVGLAEDEKKEEEEEEEEERGAFGSDNAEISSNCVSK